MPANKQPTAKNKQPEEIKAEVIPIENQDSKNTAIELGSDRLKIKRGGNIIIGTLNIMVNPISSRWQKHYKPSQNKNWSWHLIIDSMLAFFIIMLLFVNLVFWLSDNLLINQKINLEITSNNQKFISGQKTTFTINYHNGSDDSLKNSYLSLKLPANFELTNSQNNNHNSYQLGDLQPGGNGYITIDGFIIGSPNETQNLTAVLSYNLDKAAKLKKQTKSYQFQITDSLFKVYLDIKNKISNSQPIDSTIAYENQSQLLADLEITTNFKDHFFVASYYSIDPDNQSNNWQQTIDPQTKNQINISGSFQLDPKISTINNEVNLYLIKNGKKIWQSSSQKTTEITHSQIALNLSAVDNIIIPGETAKYKLTINNQEQFNLENLTLNIIADQTIFATKDAKLTPTNYSQLKLIKANQSTDLEFSLPTLASIKQTTASDKNFLTNIKVEAIYEDPENEHLKLYNLSNQLSQKINTLINFQAAGRYYTPEGDQLGIGPLPPQVNTQTKYWILISLDNLYNDIKDIIITANLAKNVSWTGNLSTTEDNPIEYNPNNQQITWKIAKVKAPSSFYPTVGGAFEISFIPEDSQIGQIADLITNIQLSAIDEFTGKTINLSLPSITTDLKNDPRATNPGVITNL